MKFLHQGIGLGFPEGKVAARPSAQGQGVQRLNELYSTNGQVGFVATERVDGKVILPEGIKLLKMKA